MANPPLGRSDRVSGAGRRTVVVPQTVRGTRSACAALQANGRIESSCPDCAEPLMVGVRRLHEPDDDLR